MAFITRNTRNALVVGPKLQHDRVPEYPTEAVREAVINALIHRRYSDQPSIQVRIYDDRLEVWNPGAIPYDLTIDSLYRPHQSHPRNPLLADAFYRAGLIEQWGSGTLRIVTECEARGLPRPEFIQDGEIFIVRFRPAPVQIHRDSRPLDVLIQQPGRLSRLNERQRKALEYLQAHPLIKRSEYMELVGVGATQATDDLAELVELGVLARVGGGRSTSYRIAAE